MEAHLANYYKSTTCPLVDLLQISTSTILAAQLKTLTIKTNLCGFSFGGFPIMALCSLHGEQWLSESVMDACTELLGENLNKGRSPWVVFQPAAFWVHLLAAFKAQEFSSNLRHVQASLSPMTVTALGFVVNHDSTHWYAISLNFRPEVL
jgi:hypothetical protein